MKRQAGQSLQFLGMDYLRMLSRFMFWSCDMLNYFIRTKSICRHGTIVIFAAKQSPSWLLSYSEVAIQVLYRIMEPRVF